MSGCSSHELASRYDSEGMAGYVEKPFRVEELQACLTSILDA
jgi:CheY-like chemotaxis protein